MFKESSSLSSTNLPPATLEAAGTLIVDVVCSPASAYLTAATTEAKKAKNSTFGTLVRCDGLSNIKL